MRVCGRKAVREKKAPPKPAVRDAERPGQSLNVDICFVPEQHEAQEKLPAVSGSSGRLVVERSPSEDAQRSWPGQVFAEPNLDYAEAMGQYVEKTRDRLVHRRSDGRTTPQNASPWRSDNARRLERYCVRHQRKLEDAAWKAATAEHRQARHAFQSLSRAQRKQQHTAWQQTLEVWSETRRQHQETLRLRQQENEAWHQRNRPVSDGPIATSDTRRWIAILVVTDNATRQCLGLPIFPSGPKLTAEELVTALGALLPDDLQFLISDQGAHFRTKTFAQLAQQASFIHVPVYRHRPQSNGIAERSVLTLKSWLRSRSWQNCEELAPWITAFRTEYNDRPHQGLPIPGLSPNEFSKRIWLM